MQNTNWKYVKRLKNENAVRDYLNAFKIDLPDSLISVLSIYNGGRPSTKDFADVNGHEYVFKSLLSYNEDDKETIYHIYPEIFAKTSLYPIGSDPAGNFICYDTKEKAYFIWNHETNDRKKIMHLPFEV